jgi:predicted phage terminase large subunit-like protein
MTYDTAYMQVLQRTPNSSLSPSQAAALLLYRRSLRTDLTAWCTSALEPQNLRPARHHKLLLDELVALERGDTQRLMVLMPPGSAKSTYASVLFPAWYLARHPQDSVIAASHTADLAARFGRRVRNMIAEHGPALGITLSPDNAAADQWSLKEGGEYFSAGVGGAVTGRRADLVVIDDPLKSRQDADSELIRDRIWDWYKTDLSTRLKPNARMVLIMTRWHEDDLGGRVLADMETGGEAWRVLRLPMEAMPGDALGREVGEPLWPEWFNASMRTQAKRDTRTWSALYQQAPAPDEGTYFLSEWLRPVKSHPPRESMRVYGASDYAVTDHGGDFTVHIVVGIDPSGRMWVLDLWRGQTASDVWVETFCDMVKQWKPLGWAEETGQINAGVGPFLTRRMRERQAFVARSVFPTRGDKSVRAQSIRGRMALDGLHIPGGAPWRADFEAELLSFPAGKHDDQVDCLGLIGQLLDRMVTPQAVPDALPMRGAAQMTMNEAWKLAKPISRGIVM